jgi:BNR repeat-like domain
MRTRKPKWLLVVLGVAATVAVAATAGAATVAPLALVSGPSPYATCTAGAGPGAVNYVNAEVEPWVAVNPANPANIIGAWQQDRWSDGGSHGLVAGYSFDGGASWGETPLPFSACARGGLDYERATDPWVSIGPDGTAYAISVSFNESNNSNAVAAATSTNGGKSWRNLRVIIADNASNFQFFNDKESVTADPTTAGTAYAAWDRLAGRTSNPYGSLNSAAFTGPGMFSKTTDGGRTWSTPTVIVPTGQNQQTIGNQIVVDRRDGTLYDFFNLIVPPFSPSAYRVAFVKSTDGGNTWTAPQVIASLQTVGVNDPNTGQAIRTGDIIPEPAIDAATGQLYVVWQDSRFNGGNYDEVALSTSTNGGATWSAPIRVNTPTGRPAFTPSVRVSSNGTVGVTYYDFRNLTSETTTLPTDYWFTSSSNHGASFGNEAHVAGPFDMLTAPNAGGFFVGDYEALDTSGTTFKSFFVQANSGNTSNRTDVFATTVTP